MSKIWQATWAYNEPNKIIIMLMNIIRLTFTLYDVLLVILVGKMVYGKMSARSPPDISSDTSLLNAGILPYTIFTARITNFFH